MRGKARGNRTRNGCIIGHALGVFERRCSGASCPQGGSCAIVVGKQKRWGGVISEIMNEMENAPLALARLNTIFTPIQNASVVERAHSSLIDKNRPPSVVGQPCSCSCVASRALCFHVHPFMSVDCLSSEHASDSSIRRSASYFAHEKT